VSFLSIRITSLLIRRALKFNYVSWGGVRLSPLGKSDTVLPLVPASDNRWWWMWSSRWNENWQGKPKYSEKTCFSAALSTTNPSWPDLGLNPGRRGGKPAINRLTCRSHKCKTSFLILACVLRHFLPPSLLPLWCVLPQPLYLHRYKWVTCHIIMCRVLWYQTQCNLSFTLPLPWLF
jgi:hypothetical protein